MMIPKDLPVYRCYKKVRALKIKEVCPDSFLAMKENRETDGSVELFPESVGFPVITVDAAFVRKHSPQPGMYFVVYDDDYASMSPAEAFEGGYVPEPVVTGPVIDRKFEFLARNPVTGKVYTERNAMVFCAKDSAVPAMIAKYIKTCKAQGCDDNHTGSMNLALARVAAFQTNIDGRRGRVPDTVGDEVARCLDGEGIDD